MGLYEDKRAWYLQQLAAGGIDSSTSLLTLKKLYLAKTLGDGVIPVWEGDSIQSAVDAGVSGSLLGYDSVNLRATGAVVDGDYVSITMHGAADGTDDVTHIFEFDDGTNEAEQTCPCGAGPHLVQPLDMEDAWGDLASAVHALLSTELQIGVITDGESGGIYIGTRSNAAKDYYYLTVSAVLDCGYELEVLTQARDRDSDMVIIDLMPGAHAETVYLYNNVVIVGRDRNACSISLPEDSTAQQVVTLGARNSGIINVTVDGGDVSAVKYSSRQMSYRTRVENCLLISDGYTISVGQVVDIWDECRIANNVLWGSNPFCPDPTLWRCEIVNNTMRYDGDNGTCFNPISLGATAGYRNIVKGNVAILQRVTEDGAQVYHMKLGGCGHLIENNTFHLTMGNYDTGRNPTMGVFQFVRGAAVPTGEAAEPTVIRHNRCVALFTGENKPTTLAAIWLNTAAGETNAISDIVLERNELYTDETAIRAGILVSQLGTADPPNITIKQGGIGGFEDAPNTLGTVKPVGLLYGSGAGVAAAALDTAFAGDASANRKLLAYWYRGHWTNTTPDPDEIHEVWTDGTNWYLTDKVTAAT